MDKVISTQLVLGIDTQHEGYFTVAVYVITSSKMTTRTDYYTHLTFTEACDVMLVTFDEWRPGSDVGGPQSQHMLW